MSYPSDDPTPELRVDELLATLARHQVQFVVIGGVGCVLYGATRTTKDLDLCPDTRDENLDRLAAALEDLGAYLRLKPEFGHIHIPPNVKLLAALPATHWRTRAGDVDVLAFIRLRPDGDPVGFRELSPRGTLLRLNDNTTILVASLEDIVRSKGVADRDKDRAALPELRRLLGEEKTLSSRAPARGGVGTPAALGGHGMQAADASSPGHGRRPPPAPFGFR